MPQQPKPHANNVAVNGTSAKPDLGLLEEDDEFEEFPADDYQDKPDDENLTIWEDDWDDDHIEDDFSKTLNGEMDKQKIDASEQMQ